MRITVCAVAALLALVITACSALKPGDTSDQVAAPPTGQAAIDRQQNEPKPSASRGFLSEEQVLKLAQEHDPLAVWRAVYEPDLLQQDGKDGKKPRPVWSVEATYAAGNRVIIRFDAVTGQQLGIFEAPAGTPTTPKR